MRALLLMLSMVCLFSVASATWSSNDHEFLPAIRVSGVGVNSASGSFLGEDWARYLSELGATQAGLTAMYAEAKRKCPKGYTIVSAPVERMTTTFSWGRGYLWVYYTSRYEVSMEIECDNDGKFPEWKGEFGVMKSKITAEEYGRLVSAKYDELKQIKTPEQLFKLVDSHRQPGVDYSPYERAKQNGEIKQVAVPSLADLCTIHSGELRQ